MENKISQSLPEHNIKISFTTELPFFEKERACLSYVLFLALCVYWYTVRKNVTLDIMLVKSLSRQGIDFKNKLENCRCQLWCFILCFADVEWSTWTHYNSVGNRWWCLGWIKMCQKISQRSRRQWLELVIFWQQFVVLNLKIITWLQDDKI